MPRERLVVIGGVAAEMSAASVPHEYGSDNRILIRDSHELCMPKRN